MYRRRPTFVLALALALLGLMASTASAATTVGSWRFDEGVGARTAVDSSGKRLHGTVGAAVRTGLQEGATTFYEFPADPPGVNREHLVVVRDSALLDPGSTGRFAVTTRFRTKYSADNIAQKGQGGTAGGYWKVELSRGSIRCTFKDSVGRLGVVKADALINDARWHTVTCERTATSVSVILDGVRKNVAVATGTIDNNWEMAIGGKSRCETVSCDYFNGHIDYLVVTRN